MIHKDKWRTIWTSPVARHGLKKPRSVENLIVLLLDWWNDNACDVLFKELKSHSLWKKVERQTGRKIRSAISPNEYQVIVKARQCLQPRWEHK